MKKLGTLKKIDDLRTVWAHEALEFTPWLAQKEYLDLLGDTIGIELELVGTEVKVGNFNIDILAKESETERTVIIENQLEDTNHDHLGKAITYAAGKNAEVIVWIVKTAREEHRKAIEWLNEHTDNKIAFFLIEMELWTIDGSDPAPKFSIVEQPNNWAKIFNNAASSEMSSTEQMRLEYWTSLKDYARSNAEFSKEIKLRKPSTDHWYSFSVGVGGTHVSMELQRQRGEIDILYNIEDDKALYHHLFEHKDEIEAIIGEPLEWNELPTKTSSRIVLIRKADVENREAWNEQFDWLMDRGLKFKKAFVKFAK